MRIFLTEKLLPTKFALCSRKIGVRRECVAVGQAINGTKIQPLDFLGVTGKRIGIIFGNNIAHRQPRGVFGRGDAHRCQFVDLIGDALIVHRHIRIEDFGIDNDSSGEFCAEFQVGGGVWREVATVATCKTLRQIPLAHHAV